MRNAHASHRQIEMAFDGLDLDFDTAQAAVLNEGFDPDLMAFGHDFDALMESGEFELAPVDLAAVYADEAVLLDTAGKARRQARQGLRSLAPVVVADELPDSWSEAA